MATRSQTAASLNTLVGGNSFTSPSGINVHLASALKASGILQSNGTYAAGRSQSDVLRLISVPSVLEEVLERLDGVAGI